MEINANPEKSDRPVDSHEEWAGSIEKWSLEIHIGLCWLRRGLPHSQRRGRTTHWVYRGDGGGRCPPRARTRRLARHLCRQHRSESGMFLPENQRINLLRKSNGNQFQPGKKWPTEMSRQAPCARPRRATAAAIGSVYPVGRSPSSLSL